MDAVLYIIITISSDFRIHAHGGYFVDMRDGGRTGRQLGARNPGTHAEALAFVDQVVAARDASGRRVEIVVDDVAGRCLAAEAAAGYPRPAAAC